MSFEPWNDPGAEPLITFENVTKRFGTFTAIDSINLSVYPREFFALLGPSGCGKTTIMRMLGGFEAVTEGSIHIDGQNMHCLLYTSPSPRDATLSRMPSSA